MLNKYFLTSIIYVVNLSVSDVAAGFAVSEFQTEQRQGKVRLSQEAGAQGFNVTGEIRGLLTGQYDLVLVNLSPGGCQEVETDSAVSPLAELNSWDQGTGDVAEIDKWIQVTAMPRREERMGILVRNCSILTTGIDCRRGDILECAEISWPSPGPSWHIWLIISAAVFLLVLLLLSIPLICYCVKRSRRKCSENDLDDEYEDRSKSPMYDELSLPFIDASLPPTPKVGRIVNGLDILLGHGVSENSLVDKKSQVQW